MRVVICVLAVVVAVAAGCATTPPAELIQARTALIAPASARCPAGASGLHKASLALDLAERAFADERNLPKAVDLAYIAERTAQIAEAHAETALTETKMAKQAAGTLTTARAQLAEARRGEAQLAQQVGVERTAVRRPSRRPMHPSRRPMRPNRRRVPPMRRPRRPSSGPSRRRMPSTSCPPRPTGAAW